MTDVSALNGYWKACDCLTSGKTKQCPCISPSMSRWSVPRFGLGSCPESSGLSSWSFDIGQPIVLRIPEDEEDSIAVVLCVPVRWRKTQHGGCHHGTFLWYRSFIDKWLKFEKEMEPACHGTLQWEDTDMQEKANQSRTTYFFKKPSIVNYMSFHRHDCF